MRSKNGSRGSAKPKGAQPGTRHSHSTPAKRGSAAPATAAGSQDGSGRKGKYNAGGEHVDGHWFASGAEAERFLQLKDLVAKETIDNLELQKTYDLTVNNVMICRYRADFSYDVLDERGRPLRHVIEDVKGMETDEFKLKRKLFDALMPVKLSIISVKGKARHPLRPALSPKTGNPVVCNRGWMHLHWNGRIPE